MCFDQKTSFGFAALGLYLAYYVHSRTHNRRLAVGIFWFFLMELLQGFQFFWIDQCENPVNQFLTLLGFIHICYQPYFTHIINSALTKNPKLLDQYTVILRLCLVGGSMLLARHFLASFQAFPIASDFNQWSGKAAPANACKTQEWLRSDTELCTYKGKYHLAWAVPMYDPTYFSPSAAIHSFLMFAPFFILKKNMIIQGFFLWLTGPYLASWISPNLQEQASVWCFMSIAQISIMLILIREYLLLAWGREGYSLHSLNTPTNGAKTNGSNGKSNGKSNGVHHYEDGVALENATPKAVKAGAKPRGKKNED